MVIDGEHNYGELFEYGLKEGQLVHIDEVENGLSCGCICPDCETPLVAYNNPKNKKANHFQHKSKVDCTNAYETALHYLAKQIILETKTLVVPDRTFSLSNLAQAYLADVINPYDTKTDRKTLIFDKVEVEKSEGTFRPDVKCFIGEKVLLIEIAVTHFVDDIKRDRILQNKLPLLEINLSKYDRTIQKDKLIEVLHGSIEDMNWLYNSKITLRQQSIIKKGQALKDFVLSNTKNHQVYGKNHDIYDCPIYKEPNGKVSADDCCYNCRYYLEEWEGIQEVGDIPSKYPHHTLDCIGHEAKAFDSLLKAHGVAIEDRK
ncbi:hypothetical protein [Terrimonas alba]|uniref:hypothetical protein n=1 Tax=Terrimonas alba TaxID=3349636 RepID=UPI0035F27C5A